MENRTMALYMTEDDYKVLTYYLFKFRGALPKRAIPELLKVDVIRKHYSKNSLYKYFAMARRFIKGFEVADRNLPPIIKNQLLVLMNGHDLQLTNQGITEPEPEKKCEPAKPDKKAELEKRIVDIQQERTSLVEKVQKLMDKLGKEMQELDQLKANKHNEIAAIKEWATNRDLELAKKLTEVQIALYREKGEL